jgi:hypothetical protein
LPEQREQLFILPCVADLIGRLGYIAWKYCLVIR